MTITEDIKYVGVNDHDIDLFEGQHQVENGMAYNSYVITDDKIAIFDTVDAHFSEEWLANIKNAVSYTHLTLPTNVQQCRSRWSPYH